MLAKQITVIPQARKSTLIKPMSARMAATIVQMLESKT
jgi:hypothetical protein